MVLVVALGLIVLAASLYLIYVLEILKFNRRRQFFIRRGARRRRRTSAGRGAANGRAVDEAERAPSPPRPPRLRARAAAHGNFHGRRPPPARIGLRGRRWPPCPPRAPAQLPVSRIVETDNAAHPPNNAPLPARARRGGARGAVGRAPAARHAAAFHPSIGIGDDKVDMFSDPKFLALGIRDVRYDVSWDALTVPSQRQQATRWLDAAHAHGLSVLLTIDHSKRVIWKWETVGKHRKHVAISQSRVLPTVSQYMAQFRAFRAHFPWVTEFVTWDETNYYGEATWNHESLVVEWWKAMQAACPKCTILAAELLDTDTHEAIPMTTWARSFIKDAGTQPKYWGLNNYEDANHLQTVRTRGLLAAVKGNIWLAETGGIVGRPGTKDPGFPQNAAHAALADQFLIQRIGALSPRIQRIYFYEWDARTKSDNWDTAIISSTGAPRESYVIIARKAALLLGHPAELRDLADPADLHRARRRRQGGRLKRRHGRDRRHRRDRLDGLDRDDGRDRDDRHDRDRPADLIERGGTPRRAQAGSPCCTSAVALHGSPIPHAGSALTPPTAGRDEDADGHEVRARDQRRHPQPPARAERCRQQHPQAVPRQKPGGGGQQRERRPAVAVEPPRAPPAAPQGRDQDAAEHRDERGAHAGSELAQAEQLRHLRWNAVSGDLVLLRQPRGADIEDVRPERDDPSTTTAIASTSAATTASSAPEPARADQRERRHQAGGGLERGRHRERDAGAPLAAVHERERAGGEEEPEERVVVRPRDGEQDHERVEAVEGDRGPRGERPSRGATRQITATVARLVSAASAFSTHSAAAIESGTSASLASVNRGP